MPLIHDAPISSGSPIQLTALAEGTAVRFHSSDLKADDFALLEALGMTRRCRLRICKVGDPWIVQVRETRIGLAASVARQLLVVPDTAL